MNYDERTPNLETNEFHYTILRYVHDLSGEEFANVGVLLFDKENQQVFREINLRYGRLSRFFNEFNGRAYREKLKAIRTTIDQFAAEYNRDLFSEDFEQFEEILDRLSFSGRSSFMWSPIRSGVAENPRQRLEELFEKYVTRHEDRETREKIDDSKLKKIINRELIKRYPDRDLNVGYEVRTRNLSHSFSAAWQNGSLQLLEPVSFDLKGASFIENKATRWRGLLDTLSQEIDFKFSALVAPPQTNGAADDGTDSAYDDAVEILKDSSTVREVVPHEEFAAFVQKINSEL